MGLNCNEKYYGSSQLGLILCGVTLRPLCCQILFAKEPEIFFIIHVAAEGILICILYIADTTVDYQNVSISLSLAHTQRQ